MFYDKIFQLKMSFNSVCFTIFDGGVGKGPGEFLVGVIRFSYLNMFVGANIFTLSFLLKRTFGYDCNLGSLKGNERCVSFTLLERFA